MEASEKIWMNGELVDRDDAKDACGSSWAHYGSGVFEGYIAATRRKAASSGSPITCSA